MSLRILSQIFLLIALLSGAGNVFAQAFDSCCSSETSQETLARADDCGEHSQGQEGESHYPCHCPVQHHSCCSIKSLVAPSNPGVLFAREGVALWITGSFFFVSPELARPFQPPKA